MVYWNVLSFVGIVSLGIILSPKTALLDILCRPCSYEHRKPAALGPIPPAFEGTKINDTPLNSSYSPWESALRQGLAALAEKDESLFFDSIHTDDLLHDLERKLGAVSKLKANSNQTTMKNASKEYSNAISMVVASEPQVIYRRIIEPITLLPEFSRLMDAYEHVLNTSSWIVLSPYMMHQLLPASPYTKTGTESDSTGIVDNPDLPDPVDLPKGWTGVAVDLDDDSRGGGGGGDESSRRQRQEPVAGHRVPRPLFAGILLQSTYLSMVELAKVIRDRLDKVSFEQYGVSLWETRKEAQTKTQTQTRPQTHGPEGKAEGEKQKAEQDEYDQEGYEDLHDFDFLGIEDDWTSSASTTGPRFQLLQTGALYWTNVSARVLKRLVRAERAAWAYFKTLDRLDEAYKGPSVLATDFALLEPWFPEFNHMIVPNTTEYLFSPIHDGDQGEGKGNYMEEENMVSAGRPRASGPYFGGSNSKNETIDEQEDNYHDDNDDGLYPDDDNEPAEFRYYYQDDPLIAWLVSKMDPPPPWASRHEWELWFLRLLLERNLGESQESRAWQQHGYMEDDDDRETGIVRLLDATNTLHTALVNAEAALDTVRNKVALWMTGLVVGEYEIRHARSLLATVWERLFGGADDGNASRQNQEEHRDYSMMKAVAELNRGAHHAGRARELLGKAKIAMENARDARADMMARLRSLVGTELLDVSVQVDVDVVTRTRRHGGVAEENKKEEEPVAVVVITLTSTQYRLSPSNFGLLLEKMAELNTRLLVRAHDVRNDWRLVRDSFSV